MAKKSKKARHQAKAQHSVPGPNKEFFQGLPGFFYKNSLLTSGLILLLLLLVFYGPIAFQGKTMLPPDTTASHSFLPFIRDALSRGIYPQWNPYINGGMPSFGANTAPFIDPVNDAVYLLLWPIRQIFHMDEAMVLQAFLQWLLNFILFGGGLILLLKRKGVSPGPALYAAIALIFLPNIVAYPAFGHTSKLSTACLIPIILLLTDHLLEKRNLFYFSLTGLVMGVQMLRGHVQISFYSYLTVGLFYLYSLIISIRNKEDVRGMIKGGALLAGAVVLGVMVSAWLNLSVWEYSHYSIRGGGESGGLDFGYATNWSFPPLELLNYLVPSFTGFGRDTYWGPMIFTDYPLYFGLVPLFLAGLALIIRRDRNTWFFAILGMVALLISFGKHFPVLYGPMFKFFPLFNKFRAPKMIQVLVGFSLMALAAIALQQIITFSRNAADKVWKHIHRYMLVFGALLGLLLLVLLAGKGAYLGWASKAGHMASAAHEKAVTDSLMSLIFFGIAAFSVNSALKKKMSGRGLLIILMAVTVFDLWRVDRRFVDFRPRAEEKAYFRATPEVEFLKSQEGQFRILTLGDQRRPNWYMYHKIKDMWGLHGAKMRTWQEMVRAFGLGDNTTPMLLNYFKTVNGRYALKTADEINPEDLAPYHAMMKIMNVKYVLCPYMIQDPALKLILPPQQRGQNALFEFIHALPPVFFPEEIMQVSTGENVLHYISSGVFDPARTAIIEEAAPFDIGPSEQNRAQIVDYDIHHITIDADIHTPCIMVLSEMYYPAGWQAYVNGEPAKTYKTDYVLRSLFLKPGRHTIEYKFHSPIFITGLLISVTVLVLLTAGAVIGWILQKKKRQPEAS